MKENKLCEAIRQVAWAYIVIHIHVKLSSIDVLADWLGYVWILMALPVIGEEVPSIKLLRPLGILLAIWTLLDWGLTIVGVTLLDSLGYFGPIVEVLYVIVHLYFHFQLLTNLAQLAAKYHCPTESGLLFLRTIRTIIGTLFALQIPWEYNDITYWIYMLIAMVQILTAFFICRALFALRKEMWGKLQESSADSTGFCRNMCR